MARYEIVAHITRHIECDTPEEAAALFRRQLLADAGAADELIHLAVWRQDPPPAVSPLPDGLRQRLAGFFVALEQSAGEAEAAFLGRVEAMLSSAATERSNRDGIN